MTDSRDDSVVAWSRVSECDVCDCPIPRERHSLDLHDGPQRKWADWLAETGYGIDHSYAIDPPCSLSALAEAYQRLDQDPEPHTIEEWEWCITQETGAFLQHGGLRCLWVGCNRTALNGSNRCASHTPRALGDAHCDHRP